MHMHLVELFKVCNVVIGYIHSIFDNLADFFHFHFLYL